MVRHEEKQARACAWGCSGFEGERGLTLGPGKRGEGVEQIPGPLFLTCRC